MCIWLALCVSVCVCVCVCVCLCFAFWREKVQTSRPFFFLWRLHIPSSHCESSRDNRQRTTKHTVYSSSLQPTISRSFSSSSSSSESAAPSTCPLSPPSSAAFFVCLFVSENCSATHPHKRGETKRGTGGGGETPPGVSSMGHWNSRLHSRKLEVSSANDPGT